MIRSLFGTDAVISMLKGGVEETSATRPVCVPTSPLGGRVP
jgi:hypothetical protein